jgi:hypothetical protein
MAQAELKAQSEASRQNILIKYVDAASTMLSYLSRF